jgi:hypothetical protein
MNHVFYTVNNALKDKLTRLVSFLTKATKEFDTIAEEIDSANLKTAMMTMAVDCSQYAKEIGEELQEPVILNTAFSEKLWWQIEERLVDEAVPAKGSEITAFCNNTEIFFNKIYEDVLAELFPHENFKNIITYQLFSIRYSFMKMRLLNKLRFDQQLTV